MRVRGAIFDGDGVTHTRLESAGEADPRSERGAEISCASDLPLVLLLLLRARARTCERLLLRRYECAWE